MKHREFEQQKSMFRLALPPGLPGRRGGHQELHAQGGVPQLYTRVVLHSSGWGVKWGWHVARSGHIVQLVDRRPYSFQSAVYGRLIYTVMYMSDRLLTQTHPDPRLPPPPELPALATTIR